MKITQNRNWMLLIILPLLVAVSFSIWLLKVDAGSEVEVFCDTAQWDLRDFNFNGDQFVRARGSIAEYVPGALLTPQEFESADYIVGKPKNAADYLTSRFRLVVPDGRVYALMTHSVDYADRIYINGQLYQEIGRPAETREDMIPQTLTQYYTVVPENGVIEIVQQVSNFVHVEGGNPTGFRIGSIETAGRHYNRTLNMSAFVLGCCLLLALVHLVLFLLLPSYKGNLYFALFCLVWLMQTAVSGPRVITALFPRISWEFTFRVGYISLPVSILLLMLALDAMFPGLMQVWVKRVGAALLLIAAGVYSLADTVVMSRIANGVNGLCILMVVYLLARLWWRLIHKRERSVELIIVLAGQLVLAYAALRDALYYNNIHTIPNVSAALLDMAALVFILFQMTANFYGTMEQVAEARRAKQRMADEKEMLAEMSRRQRAFYTDISHELKTPLTVISANAQFAAQNIRAGAADEETLTDLDIIITEAKRLAELVRGLVGLNRAQDGGAEQTPLCLDAVMADTACIYKSLLDKRGNRLTVTVEPGLPPVKGNADQLSQVLINLLSNANRHTHKGTIAVDVRRVGEQVRVSVADTGEGIDPALLPYVFERFRRGAQEGTGLGLPICKSIIEAHGGNIELKSEAGKGTTLWFTLPLKGEPGDE